MLLEVTVAVRAHESGVEVSSMQTHRESLSAVLLELQLKFQDSGITVTNGIDFAEIEAQLFNLTGLTPRVN